MRIHSTFSFLQLVFVGDPGAFQQLELLLVRQIAQFTLLGRFGLVIGNLHRMMTFIYYCSYTRRGHSPHEQLWLEV